LPIAAFDFDWGFTRMNGPKYGRCLGIVGGLGVGHMQAVGLGVARVHMLLDGIDLDTRSRRNADPRAKLP
jgi:hypothetical protein